MITVVNPWDWLEPDGSLPLEPRLRKRVLRVAQCIEYGGPLARGESRETLIPCRRRPGRKSCLGLLWVLKREDDAILAFCVACKSDEFLISKWEDTDWADGPMEPVVPVNVAAITAELDPDPAPSQGTARPHDPDADLRRALEVAGCTMPPHQVRELVQSSVRPMEVVERILQTSTLPPTKAALDELLPLLIELWDSAPRDELFGRSPESVHGEPRGRQVGRNAPCPCGSGLLYRPVRSAPAPAQEISPSSN